MSEPELWPLELAIKNMSPGFVEKPYADIVARCCAAICDGCKENMVSGEDPFLYNPDGGEWQHLESDGSKVWCDASDIINDLVEESIIVKDRPRVGQLMTMDKIEDSWQDPPLVHMLDGHPIVGWAKGCGGMIKIYDPVVFSANERLITCPPCKEKFAGRSPK